MSDSIIQEIQTKLNNKEITCTELVQEKIAAVKASDKNATNSTLENMALKQAADIDEKIASGQVLSGVEGIPFGVKERDQYSVLVFSRYLHGYLHLPVFFIQWKKYYITFSWSIITSI